MPALTFNENITRTDANGVEHIAVVCWKCGGAGYLPGYEFSDNARCWACNAHRGPLGWRTRDEYDRIMTRRAKDAERRARKARAEAEQAAREFEEWKAANAEVVTALLAYTGHSSFLTSLAYDVETGRALTPAQVEAAAKALATETERKAEEVEVPEGRQTVEGVIVSVKEVADNFSYTERYITKVVVACDGFRIYGTLPSSISGAEKGDRIRFTATLQGKEKGFGFFKRPTKAEVIS